MIVSIAIGWAYLESRPADHDRRIDEPEASDKALMKDRMAEARGFADMRWSRDTLVRPEKDWKGRERGWCLARVTSPRSAQRSAMRTLRAPSKPETWQLDPPV